MQEVEIKYRLRNDAEADQLRARLEALGTPQRGRQREVNVLFDDAAKSLEQAGAILRLRILDSGPAGRLTFKGAAAIDRGVKTRREIELAIADADTTRALLEALGYRERRECSYWKIRDLWTLNGVDVALDELEFGRYCELEGEEQAIRALAERLGLDDDQVELASYPDLVARYASDSTSGPSPGRRHRRGD
jgi:predicted adenylyl cyclase CyaB